MEGLRSQVVLVSGSSPGQSPECTKLYTLHTLQQRRLDNWIKTFAGGLSEERAKASASSQLEGVVKGQRRSDAAGREGHAARSGSHLCKPFDSTRTLEGADEGTKATQGKKLLSSFDETARQTRLRVQEGAVFRD